MRAARSQSASRTGATGAANHCHRQLEAGVRAHAETWATGRTAARSADPRLGQFVHDHLAVATRAHEPGSAQLPNVVGHELVRALAHPGEIADAQFAPLTQSDRDREARRVSESLRHVGST